MNIILSAEQAQQIINELAEAPAKYTFNTINMLVAAVALAKTKENGKNLGNQDDQGGQADVPEPCILEVEKP